MTATWGTMPAISRAGGFWLTRGGVIVGFVLGPIAKRMAADLNEYDELCEMAEREAEAAPPLVDWLQIEAGK